MKSAFLIMAHSNFDMLKLLVTQLDYKDNDIYIHIDKKVVTLIMVSLKP